MYVAMGACGLPVFAGGASTLALVGPSAGFILGFVPAIAVTATLASTCMRAGCVHVIAVCDGTVRRMRRDIICHGMHTAAAVPHAPTLAHTLHGGGEGGGHGDRGHKAEDEAGARPGMACTHRPGMPDERIRYAKH